MRPAFSSSRSAGAFALLLAGLMALPALVARTGWLDRRDVYPAIPWKYGPFPWIQKKIFSETNDVDIAFLGSSLIWCGINPSYVQRQLSAKLGHEAEVFTLGWPWPGYDAPYFIARDLLEHRRVRMLVIYDEVRGDLAPTDAPHIHSSRWFRLGDNSEALDGLTWPDKLSLYSGTVLGAPRSLLSLLRPNLTEDPAHCRPNIWNTVYHAANFVEQRGAVRVRLGFNNKKDFLPYEPPTTATPADAVIYSAATRSAFTFTGPPTRPYRLHFARKLAQLCQEHGTRLVILHLPGLGERTKATIPEREPWPEVLGAPVSLVGIPGVKFFANIPAENATLFYFSRGHLNQNGQDRFTPLVTPALLELYADPNKF